MTEDEAKTKWCPAVRVVGETSMMHPMTSREDRIGELPKGDATSCIGSACMAWRKTGEAKVENRHGKLIDRDLDGTGRWHYDGYCGLAGEP